MAATPSITAPQPKVRVGEAPGEPRNHALTAALIGGAAAAAAGAVWGAKAWAESKAIGGGKPLNAVMKNALTASQVAPHQSPSFHSDSGTVPEEISGARPASERPPS
jgi:hypothetical protein